MSKKINEKFIKAYIELDKLCCENFSIQAGGVTEYINRLSNIRFAPGRDEVLPHLVKFRNIRNVFAHEPNAVKKNDELNSKDLTWISKFSRDLKRKKDPISLYLRKAKRYMRGKRIKRYLIAGAIILALFVAVILFFQFR